jgi:Asp-tRNA(Asn)/Glu-tRNA(Gln) amidotransferase A subunit family amidase
MHPHPAGPDEAAVTDLTRRNLFHALAAAGIGTTVFQRALAAEAAKTPALTPELVKQAEWIAGLELTEAERKAVVGTLGRWFKNFDRLRAVTIDNSVPFPLVFQPVPGPTSEGRGGPVEARALADPMKPASADDLAFLPLTELAGLLRTRKVSSVELTRLYLGRLREYDPLLHCVVTLTEKTALEQAEQADREIAAGRYRGPLHGIPWGAKDLIAYPGYPTTWGAEPYKDQHREGKATVARRLEEAGAVLVAKLSLGALAYGDQWFGGRTRNPWNPMAGSSGSSAGSASATAAGLVGFALGSETWGSIVSPCRACAVTGLRPTFGRVSRHGCMTLSWSMDKIGPLARSVEDCALIFGAIHGRDGLDGAAVDRPFSWPCKRDLRTLKVGYFKGRTGEKELKVLGTLGVKLMPIELPGTHPIDELAVILFAEAAAVFDDLTRLGVRKGIENWANSFLAGEFIPAVEYIRANRIRALLMKEMEELFSSIDLYVDCDTAEFRKRESAAEVSNRNLLLTNLTGHPQVVLPASVGKPDAVERPSSITFTGKLYGETELLAVAHAFQQATGAHRRRPTLPKAEKKE